jgi:hypothetical protein
MRKTLVLCLMLVFATSLLVSCKKKQDIEADKAAVRALVEQDTTHFSGGTSHDSTGGFFTDGDTLVLWWRGQQTHDPAAGVSVGVNGDSAWVDFSQHNYGYFHVLALPPGETLQLWNKPLSENVHLRAIFLRTGDSQDTSTRGWKLDKISLFAAQSDTTHNVKIDSMTIVSSLRSVSITNPLDYFQNLDTMITFTPGEELTITLHTANATAGKAFLHTFVLFWPFYVRVPFTDMGNGVFQGVWHAPYVKSVRFAIFDLLARSSIYGPGQPYDFNGWLLFYKVNTAD